MVASSRLAIVTGSNKGIGLEVVRGLLAGDRNLKVVMACRDVSRGEEAKQSLNGGNIDVLELDVSSPQSVAKFAEVVRERYGGVDVLVNNAAVAWKGDAFDEHVVDGTFGTNYWGLVSVTKALIPLLRDNATVVNVSSVAGKITHVKPALRASFEDPNLTQERLSEMMTEFQEAVRKNTYAQEGWAKSGYGMSKVGVTAYSRLLGRDYQEGKLATSAKNVQFTAVCPGWCQTDMGGQQAPRSAKQGAAFIVQLCLQPHDAKWQGAYGRDGQVVSW